MNSQNCPIQDKRHGLSYYKGLYHWCKEKLSNERSSHKDELIRLKQQQRVRYVEFKTAIHNELSENYAKLISDLESTYKAKEKALIEKIVDLEKELSLYKDQVSGKGRSEKIDTSSNSLEKKHGSRKKGKKEGTQGYGRRLHIELAATTQIYPLSEEERRCPVCGLIAEETEMAVESEEVEYTVNISRKRRRRPKYKRTCRCESPPVLLVAPAPLKAMTKSKYSDSFWIELLLQKYEYQVPVTSFISQLHGHGLQRVNGSTLANGIKRAYGFLKPLYDEIVQHNKTANHWHCDDTRLAVFIEREGRKSFNWYLWQQTTRDTVVFELSPTRSGETVQNYFADLGGIISADRAAVFKNLGLIVAFCWVHVRRDFIKAGRYTKGNRTWAISWLRKIRCLYRINRTRLKTDSSSFSEHDLRLRRFLSEMYDEFTSELLNAKLLAVRRKILSSLDRHWEGLTVFVDHPEIPMDNNTAEQNFRKVAKLRKNSYGVFSVEFGEITAVLLTIFATLNRNGINVRSFLEIYFKAVAFNSGGVPDDIGNYLPWNLSEELSTQLRFRHRQIA